MAGINRVVLIGNLGNDPDLSYSQAGGAIANASLATTERRKKGDEWIDHTEWHNLVFSGKTAETVARYCGKGKQIYVEGSIYTHSWEDKETSTRKDRTEIVCNKLVMLGKKEDGGRPGPKTGQPDKPDSVPPDEKHPAGQDSEIDDDLPF